MNRWDVYWADVPFEEDASLQKLRPVVIAKDATVYVLTLRVTSHGVRQWDAYDYSLQFWREAGLTSESVVRIRKLARLKPEAIHGRIGKLHPVDALEIQKRMTMYLQESKAKSQRGQ